jgi:hypothetical protein
MLTGHFPQRLSKFKRENAQDAIPGLPRSTETGITEWHGLILSVFQDGSGVAG